MFTKKGFTLIELLVVISIISLMSSVVLAAVQQARDKALNARARADVKVIVDAINYAEGESNQNLLQMGGANGYTNWTNQRCIPSQGYLPTDAACLTRVDQALSSIEAATNGLYTNLPRKDPWGIPYQIDANFGEALPRACFANEGPVTQNPCYCARDGISLLNANGTAHTITGLATVPKFPFVNNTQNCVP